jgi:hypothetical protein
VLLRAFIVGRCVLMCRVCQVKIAKLEELQQTLTGELAALGPRGGSNACS